MWGEGYLVRWIGEEVEPILGLVECFGEEDEVGAVGGGGLDVHASQFDVFGVDAFRFWVGEGVLPRMCWIVEKQ